MRPVIALLSDFGSRDHYAGTMKGVMIGICPDVTFLDITHDITPHDVVEGALQLAASYRFFPAGTIFLAIVDPGVGSPRRGIAAEAGDYRFVAPDNGVLTAVLDEVAPKRIVELTERRYARATVSRTFEGRDRFAPAAAWLARGIELAALGRPAGAVQRLDLPRPSVAGDHVAGEVLRVDRFGNLITNIDRATLEQVTGAGPLTVMVGAQRVHGVVATYADVPPGELCALIGSSNYLEIAVNAARAAEILGIDRGAAVHVSSA